MAILLEVFPTRGANGIPLTLDNCRNPYSLTPSVVATFLADQPSSSSIISFSFGDEAMPNHHFVVP